MLLTITALLACIPHLASGHTWVEQAKRIAANGTMVEPLGFPPNWNGRDAPGFTDKQVSNPLSREMPRICDKQTIGQQTATHPALTAAPGDFVALRYTENGHVSSLEAGKPLNKGTVYVYGTLDPRPDEDIASVFKQWTADGTGGDGRGKLIATRNYDDGQCFEAGGRPISQERAQRFPKETNAMYGPNLWCQTDLQIPTDIPQGSQYAVYWIWTWPTLVDNAGSENGQYGDFAPGGAPVGLENLESDNVVKNEIYSSCVNINVEGEPLINDDSAPAGQQGPQSLKSLVTANFAADPRADYNEAAVREQMENLFLVEAGSAPDNNRPEQPPRPDQPQQPAQPNPDQPAAPAPTPTGMRTVIVTAEPTTVWVTTTIVPDSNGGIPTGAPAPPPGEVPGQPIPTVEPFMARRNRRAARAARASSSSV